MSYLKNLAQTFAREVGDNLRHYVFVFPNQRAGLFFRRDLGLALGRPTLSPQIMTINDCFYSLTNTQLADPIDLLLRIARIHNEIRAEQHLEPEPLDKFLFWGKMLLGDFNEIDNHLVPDVKHFFDNIRDLHTIDSHFNPQSTIATQVAHHPQSTNWEAPLPLYELYTRLQSELRAEGLAYDGMLHREVIESLTLNSTLSTLNYVFIGFNALTASEEQLMLYFKEHGQADFYFDYSDALVTDKNNRASLFMEHNLSLFPSKYDILGDRTAASCLQDGTACLQVRGKDLACSEASTNHSSVAKRPISPQYHYIEVNSTVAEAQEVHRILDNLTAKRSYSEAVFQCSGLTRTAVVLPDERLLIPLLHTLPESIDKVNVTMGYPLSATPTYALISLITDLQQRMTQEGFYHKDVTAILSHPYVYRLAPEACDAIKQDIVKRNRIYVDAATFAKDEYLSLIFSTDPNAWREILNHFPDDASEAVYRVQTVLNRIDKYLGEGLEDGAECLQVRGDISLNFKLSTLNLMLSSETIAYTGEPLEGLQIMGILETRALDFDNIILTGFNDDLYPGNSISNSFIPYEVRCEYHLPTVERKDAVFAYNFYRMIGYAKQVWFIANTRADEQHSGEPSRYLYQLHYQFGKQIQHYVVVDSPSAEGGLTAQRSYSEAVFQRSGLTLNSKLSTLNSFSPSGLNSYLRCPRLYYWQYIQGLREPEQVHEDIDPRELGSQLHLLLQNFYEPFCGKTVTKEDIEKMLEKIGERLEDGSRAAYWLEARTSPVAKRPLTCSEASTNHNSSAVLTEYARLILERDLALAPFTYIATEQPRQMDLTLDDGSVVTLKGTIDRVDTPPSTIHHPQSTIHRIVDYKTGGAKLEFSSVASLFDPTDANRNSYALQTILYAILYGEHCGTGIRLEPHIYGVRLLAQGPDTAVHQKGQESVDIAVIKDEFMGHLRQLISEIRDPQNTFPCTDDDYNKCSTCSFAKLCGKSQSRQ